MNSEKIWRLGIVAVVTAVSLWLVTPTVFYFLAVSGKIKTSETELEKLRLKSVPLGLDLQGGVDVLLAVDTNRTRQEKVDQYADDIRERFRNESPAIDATVEVTSGTSSIVVNVKKPEQIRPADNILTTFKNNKVLPDYVPGQIAAGQPLTLAVSPQVLNVSAEETINSSLRVIRERVDKLNVTQPVVVKQGTDRIRVQLPGEKNPEQVVKNIIRPAFLEFRGVYTTQMATGANDAYQEASSEIIDLMSGKPLPGKQIPFGYESRLYRDVKSTSDGGTTYTERFMLVKRKYEMTGRDLADAWVGYNTANLNSPVQINLQFKPAGAEKFGEVTERYIKKPLAVLLDGVVYTAPTVQQKIDGGTCEITGGFNNEEAHQLSLILKAGALPAELKTVQNRTVEATLGADSIKKSVFALGLGSIVIAIYMIIYYGAAGVIAVIATGINVLLIFAFMKLSSATLTLSGIGGILLTVGMAVDANVLIYERIREEITAGKSRKAAIALGFSRAFSVIFDANLTTLISGLVLLQFGEGSVKGFALTLNIGILATLFTGLFCTHALVDLWFSMRNHLGVGKLRWFKSGIYIDFVGFRKYSYTFSTVLFTICLLWILPFKPFPGSNWGVDFEGGVVTEIVTTQEMQAQAVQGSFHDWRVQKILGENRFMIRSKTDDKKQSLADTETQIRTRLDQTVGQGNYTVAGSESVSNEVGSEFTRTAVISCILASIGILIYVAFRFEFLFGFAGVVALFHDLIIAYGLFNILGRMGLAGEVTLDVVSALLVILGYSINDTIIIFDRVRENMKLHPGMPFRQLLNTSICESLNRTVMTVSTVVFVLLVMLIFGGAGLYDFALVLLIGIIKGTYSSSFVATPVLFDMHERAERKRKSTMVRRTAAAKA